MNTAHEVPPEYDQDALRGLPQWQALPSFCRLHWSGDTPLARLVLGWFRPSPARLAEG